MKKIFLPITLTLLITIALLCGCSSTEEQYAEIKKQIEKSEQLQNNYFAQYYDLNELNATMEKAEKILSNSDEDSYEEILSQITKENDKLAKYIKKETNKIYNKQTSAKGDEEYPFKVDASEVPDPWSFRPIVKQTSKNPTWIVTDEPATTDGEPTAAIFFDGPSAIYLYDLENIETKEIQVQNKDKEIVSALVNTQVNFTVDEGFDFEEPPFIEEHPAYLMKNKNGNIILAVQCRDEGSDFFILYNEAE